MLYNNKRSEIEASKAAIRNTVNTFISLNGINVDSKDKCQLIRKYIVGICPELDNSITKDSVELEGLFEEIDSTLGLEFDKLNLSKITEDFVFNRKQIEKFYSEKEAKAKKAEAEKEAKAKKAEAEKEAKKAKAEAKFEADKKAKEEAKAKAKNFEDDINKAKAAAEKINAAKKAEAEKEAETKVEDTNKTTSKAEDIIDEQISMLQSIIKSNYNDDVKSSIDDLIERLKTVKASKVKPESEKTEKEPVLIYDDEIINILNIGSKSPLQFTKKSDCINYLDKKANAYEALNDKYDLSADKINQLIELKLPIKIGNDLSSIAKSIRSFSNNNKNTLNQLKDLCINLSKLEGIIFY